MYKNKGDGFQADAPFSGRLHSPIKHKEWSNPFEIFEGRVIYVSFASHESVWLYEWW